MLFQTSDFLLSVEHKDILKNVGYPTVSSLIVFLYFGNLICFFNQHLFFKYITYTYMFFNFIELINKKVKQV